MNRDVGRLVSIRAALAVGAPVSEEDVRWLVNQLETLEQWRLLEIEHENRKYARAHPIPCD
jgi:hypothetical protein